MPSVTEVNVSQPVKRRTYVSRDVKYIVYAYLRIKTELTPTCSAGTLTASGPKANIFCICCRTDKFLKVIPTAMVSRRDLRNLRLTSPIATCA